LAQALINDPDLLILDEPTTGLDPIGTRQIKDLVLELAKRGKTVLLCSHLLADVEDVCDRIAILYGGKIQIEGQVKELLQQTHKKQITTDAISDTAVEKIKQIIQQEHAQCDISSPMDKLEAFFIKTVSSAEHQALPTNGAVSTTHISSFLAPDASAEDILDKLVSASVSAQPPVEPVTTEQVVPVETPEPTRQGEGPAVVPKGDEDLLSKLTEPAPASSDASRGGGPSQPDKTKAVVKNNEEIKTKPVESQEQAQKNILDKLTKDENTAREQTAESEAGDFGDA